MAPRDPSHELREGGVLNELRHCFAFTRADPPRRRAGAYLGQKQGAPSPYGAPWASGR